jgi:RimJ/RimL family protein N-acetyltransferase
MLPAVAESLVPPDPPLQDGDVVLRPWRRADADAVFRACQDPEIHRWVPIPQPYERRHADGFVSGEFGGWADGSAPFCIADAATDEVLGAITVHEPQDITASVGYWLAPWARGRGVITRALRLVSRWSFEELPIQRLQLYTLVGNDRSGAVALRVGFTREGVLRNWELHRGVPVDIVMYSLVRGDLTPP